MSNKKLTDPDGAMKELIKRAVDIAVKPFDEGRAADLPSLRSVAETLGTTVIRARKLLITAGYSTSATAKVVQRMSAEAGIHIVCRKTRVLNKNRRAESALHIYHFSWISDSRNPCRITQSCAHDHTVFIYSFCPSREPALSRTPQAMVKDANLSTVSVAT